jgi:hypothetical protein
MFRKLFQSIFRKETKNIYLGRWERHNYNKTIQKIDWANEDHCGTCSNGIKKIKTMNEENQKYLHN